MTEIYRGNEEHLYLDVYSGVLDSAPSAVLLKNDGSTRNLVVSPVVPAPNGISERYSCKMNIADTSVVGKYHVTWSFTIEGQPGTKVDDLVVVVPLVGVEQARSDLEIGDEVSDEQIIRAERRARIQIQTITGERFESYAGTSTGVFIDPGKIRVKERIESFSSFDYFNYDQANNYYIDDNGYYLTSNIQNNFGSIVSAGFPIKDPYTREYFRRGKTIPITGVFGWSQVPTEITEACLILIEANLCADSIYRERYLVSMTAADWRIQFNSGAYRSTGNVVADQILENFRRNYTSVI